MSIVSADNLGKNYGSFQAVKNLSIEIPKAKCFGLLGPNGAGKSTFISMIYGATSISSGSLRVFGRNPETEAREIKRKIGVVTQDNYLDTSMTVEENMMTYGRFVGLSYDLRKKKVAELLDFMSLSHKKDSVIMALSGGMQRRLVFVRALLNDPDLLILDEPTTGLDPAVRHLLWEKIRELRDQGKTVILTTHYMDEAERLCDDIVIMSQGEVVSKGAPKALIHQNCPGMIADFSSNTKINESLIELANHNKQIEVRIDKSGTSVRAPDLKTLSSLIEDNQLEPEMVRPTNLEDVFLKITGKELTQDA